MQALAAPSRLRILGRLRAGPCSVGELAEAVGMETVGGVAPATCPSAPAAGRRRPGMAAASCTRCTTRTSPSCWTRRPTTSSTCGSARPLGHRCSRHDPSPLPRGARPRSSPPRPRWSRTLAWAGRSFHRSLARGSEGGRAEPRHPGCCGGRSGGDLRVLGIGGAAGRRDPQRWATRSPPCRSVSRSPCARSVPRRSPASPWWGRSSCRPAWHSSRRSTACSIPSSCRTSGCSRPPASSGSWETSWRPRSGCGPVGGYAALRSSPTATTPGSTASSRSG